jgi:hypothetical protein
MIFNSNNIQKVPVLSKVFVDSCADHNNFVSCQLINYKRKESIICFLCHHNSGIIHLEIFSLGENHENTERDTLWNNNNED